MHELLEKGFEVTVIKDATTAAQIPEGDGFLAALINFESLPTRFGLPTMQSID